MPYVGLRGHILCAGLFLAGLSAPAAAQGPGTLPPPNIEDDFAYPMVRFSLSLGSGARALGMGGAFLARPDDASAASWNPAGLSYLRRPELTAAGVQSSANVQAFGPNGRVAINERQRSVSPDFLAAAYPLEIGGFNGAVQLSFQRVIPFGGRRSIARGAQIRLQSSGGFDTLAAGFGIQLSRKVRLGGTVNRWMNGYEVASQRTLVRPSARETVLTMGGWNSNIGVIISPFEDLNLGFVGKTPLLADATLKRSRRDVGPPETTNAAYRDDLRIHFPATLGVGMSWRVSKPLTFSMDVTRAPWSDAKIENFFDLPAVGPPVVYPSLPFPTLRGPGQEDTQQIRAGAEYVVILGSLKWPLRAGFVDDRQYVAAQGGIPHFTTVTLGTGIVTGPVLFDVAYAAESGRFWDIDGSGFRIVANRRFFASLIYRFSHD